MEFETLCTLLVLEYIVISVLRIGIWYCNENLFVYKTAFSMIYRYFLQYIDDIINKNLFQLFFSFHL